MFYWAFSCWEGWFLSRRSLDIRETTRQLGAQWNISVTLHLLHLNTFTCSQTRTGLRQQLGQPSRLTVSLKPNTSLQNRLMNSQKTRTIFNIIKSENNSHIKLLVSSKCQRVIRTFKYKKISKKLLFLTRLFKSLNFIVKLKTKCFIREIIVMLMIFNAYKIFFLKKKQTKTSK